jgi:23S rRNA (adenine2503-C2)-methyltransferase
MEELRAGLVEALLKRPNKNMRTCMLEVTLIDNKNDGIIEANELAQFALDMMDMVPSMKLIINLIPFNDIGHMSFRKPSMERVLIFQRILVEKGILAYIRTTRGDDESSACGQLTTKKLSSY